MRGCLPKHANPSVDGRVMDLSSGNLLLCNICSSSKQPPLLLLLLLIALHSKHAGCPSNQELL